MRAAEYTSRNFLMQTTLLPGEYRVNFRQIDCDAIRLVTSGAARKVTTLMAHVYLSLIDAHMKFRERDGVLRFAGEVREGKMITAWEQLTETLGVADGTAHKALTWMAEQKLIGYHAGKNGVGIRIFLNRAVNSVKREIKRNEKILPLAPTSRCEDGVSQNAMPFNNHERDLVDKRIIRCAPKTGANSQTTVATSFPPNAAVDETACPSTVRDKGETEVAMTERPFISVDGIVDRLKRELEPCVEAAATRAASRAAAREHEQTRQWLDKHGLPKAARVAQREAYNVFRHQEGKLSARGCLCADSQFHDTIAIHTRPEAKSHTSELIREIAETCLTLLEVQGKPIEITLAEMCAEGGWLLPSDVPRVRAAVEDMKRVERYEKS